MLSLTSPQSLADLAAASLALPGALRAKLGPLRPQGPPLTCSKSLPSRPAGFRLPLHELSTPRATYCPCGYAHVPLLIWKRGPGTKWIMGGHSPRLMWPKEKMQPSAPLTTDWSTSATVPEQTSACGRDTVRYQGQGGRPPASHHACPHHTQAGSSPGGQAGTHRFPCAPRTRHTQQEPARHMADRQAHTAHTQVTAIVDTAGTDHSTHSTGVVPARTGHTEHSWSSHTSRVSSRRGGALRWEPWPENQARSHVETPKGRGGQRGKETLWAGSVLHLTRPCPGRWASWLLPPQWHRSSTV